MARNAQLRSQSRYSGSRQLGGELRGSELREPANGDQRQGKFVDSNGNLKLSMKQVITFWTGSVIIMLLAFYVGFVAGKREGAIAVLDRAGEDMVRLELHTPVEPYPKVLELGDSATNSGPSNAVPPKIPRSLFAGSNNNIAPEAPKIDFTGSNSLPTVTGNSNVPSKISNPALDTLPVNPASLKSLRDGAVAPVLPAKDKTLKKEEVQEVYRGKELFGPPRTKSEEQKPGELLPMELPKSESNSASNPPKAVDNVALVKSLAPSKGWYVQVSAAPSEDEAAKFYDKIKSKGLSGSLEPAAIKDRSFYRVLVGPFPSQAAAMTKRVELKQSLAIPGEPFIRQIQ